MMICSTCNEEMVCSRTGVVVVWGMSHARNGDEYKCLECGAKAVYTNAEAYSLSHLSREALEQRNYLVQMD